MVVEDQEHRFRWVGTCWPLAPTQGQQIGGALVLWERQIREDSPKESHHLQRHGVQPLAGIQPHDAAPVEINGVVGVLDCQLALAHPAHTREISPAAFWCQEALELLQFLAAAHEPLGAGGALWEVVGGVRGKGGIGLWGFLNVGDLVAVDLVTCELVTCDHVALDDGGS